MISPVNRLTLAVGMVIATLVGQAAAAPVAPSENVTINLIRLLVQQGVLTQDTANGLIAQAEKEAQQARQANAAPVVAAGPTAAPGDVRVQYVPQAVKDQIRDQVKAEVMATAKQENWAQPNTFPDWVSRITVEGDVRVDELDQFAEAGACGTWLAGAVCPITPRSLPSGARFALLLAYIAMPMLITKNVIASHLVLLLRKLDAPRAPKTVAEAPPPKPEPACAPEPRCIRIRPIIAIATST